MLDKVKRKSGFTLAEMMLTVLLMSIVLAGLTGAVGAAVNVYNKVRAKSEAEVLLATVADAIEADLSTATNIHTADNGQVTDFYSGNRGFQMSYRMDTSSAPKTIKIQVIKVTSASTGTSSEKAADGENKKTSSSEILLVSQGAQPFGIYPVLDVSSLKLLENGTISYKLKVCSKQGRDLTDTIEYFARPITK